MLESKPTDFFLLGLVPGQEKLLSYTARCFSFCQPFLCFRMFRQTLKFSVDTSAGLNSACKKKN
jgi:hypothetical protein